MAGEPSGLLKAIETLAASIKSRPEAALAGIAILAPALLIPMGVNQWMAMIAPIGVYIIYCGRSVMAERHKERIAEMKIEAVQAAGDKRITDLAEKYLKRLPEGGKDND
ncbi:hypothetical protein [Devosia sp. Root635]|uniref:hypothetical protein n=1 Tax=Devosia sp. Root635 TaxID=1736575 RepID=UPI0006F8885F|nr:hypothetical protein [Devosia sp. Root635]KRA42067.1 hypothetical protein ASD80_10090 [Devosia sp. Root635]